MNHHLPIPPPEKPEAPVCCASTTAPWSGTATWRPCGWSPGARTRSGCGRCAAGGCGPTCRGARRAPAGRAAGRGEDRGRVGRVVNGAITAEVTERGIVRFLRADGSELLSERPAHFWWPGARLYTPTGNGHHRPEQRFAAYDGEKLFGLGQHRHGLLDQKGATIDLVQRNAEVSIPVLLSDRGYLLLWNDPAVGRVELAVNGTRWVADSARQFDYWITAGRPAETLARYADATGHSPELPSWAIGFWQCKLRYRTQEELLSVARRLSTSSRTLRRRIRVLCDRIGVRTPLQAAVWAARRGLI